MYNQVHILFSTYDMLYVIHIDISTHRIAHIDPWGIRCTARSPGPWLSWPSRGGFWSPQEGQHFAPGISIRYKILIYIYIYIHNIYIYTHTNTNNTNCVVYMYMYIFLYTHICWYYIYIYMYMCLYMHICMYLYTYVCTYHFYVRIVYFWYVLDLIGCNIL